MTAARAIIKIGTLLERQSGQDARTIAALDRDIERLSPAALKWRSTALIRA